MFVRAIVLSAAALALAATASPAGAAGHAPVAVELFTSQGCSACVAANGLTAALDGRPGVLALTFPVDYWDYLGWRDTYAQPAFSERQRAYAKALGLREVYTPQVVVGGAAEAKSAQAGAPLAETVEALIRKAQRNPPSGPQMRLMRHGKAMVGSGRAPPGGAELWLVRYQPTPPDVTVTDGENRGHAVQYRNVVRQLERLGDWSGRSRAYDAPEAPEGGLKTALLLQAKDGGRILGVLAE